MYKLIVYTTPVGQVFVADCYEQLVAIRPTVAKKQELRRIPRQCCDFCGKQLSDHVKGASDNGKNAEPSPPPRR